MKEKKARVEDALNATRAAVEEGIVPGVVWSCSVPCPRWTASRPVAMRRSASTSSAAPWKSRSADRRERRRRRRHRGPAGERGQGSLRLQCRNGDLRGLAGRRDPRPHRGHSGRTAARGQHRRADGDDRLHDHRAAREGEGPGQGRPAAGDRRHGGRWNAECTKRLRKGDLLPRTVYRPRWAACWGRLHAIPTERRPSIPTANWYSAHAKLGELLLRGFRRRFSDMAMVRRNWWLEGRVHFAVRRLQCPP